MATTVTTQKSSRDLLFNIDKRFLTMMCRACRWVILKSCKWFVLFKQVIYFPYELNSWVDLLSRPFSSRLTEGNLQPRSVWISTNFKIVKLKLMRFYSVTKSLFPSLIIISRKVKFTENILSISLMLFTKV